MPSMRPPSQMRPKCGAANPMRNGEHEAAAFAVSLSSHLWVKQARLANYLGLVSGSAKAMPETYLAKHLQRKSQGFRALVGSLSPGPSIDPAQGKRRGAGYRWSDGTFQRWCRRQSTSGSSHLRRYWP